MTRNGTNTTRLAKVCLTNTLNLFFVVVLALRVYFKLQSALPVKSLNRALDKLYAEYMLSIKLFII